MRLDRAAHDYAHPNVVAVDSDGGPVGERLDLVFEEEDAFWGFAVVEVLRHTGIRIEELLELTQLDLHDYDHRDPTVGKVLLLHISPSKQDRERMVVVAPELAATFAVMARRIRAAVGSTDTALPSLVAYDYAECVNSEPLRSCSSAPPAGASKARPGPCTRHTWPGSSTRSPGPPA